MGGKVVKIVRPQTGASVGSQHESENALLHYEGFDNVVVNTGSLEAYYTQLDALMEMYGYADRKIG